MLNLNLLRVFHTVVQRKTVAKAAEALYVSQPAVSNSLRKLQQEYNITLFTKNGRNLQLTESGEALYALAEKMFVICDEIENYLEVEGLKARNTVRIGLVPLYERFGVSDIIHQFSQIDSNISVSIYSGNTKTIIQMLQDRSIDLAITGNLVSKSGIDTRFYRKHSIYLVIPEKHRLHGLATFKPEDIMGERVALKEKGSSVRQVVDAYCQRNSVKLDVAVELSNIDALLSIAQTEGYLTFLPDFSLNACENLSSKFSVAEPDGDEIFFSAYVISHPLTAHSESLSKTIDKFYQMIHSRQQNEITVD